MLDSFQTLRGLMAVGLACLLGAVGGGCHLIKGAADLPGDAVRVMAPDKPKVTPVDPAELQQHLMRFADQYVAQVVEATDAIERGDPGVDRVLAQQTRVNYASDVWMAAAGPNPYANLLDLITIVTLTRGMVEERWISVVAGNAAVLMLQATTEAERDIWDIGSTVLSTNQQDELKEAIRVWCEDNPEALHASYVRAVGMSGRVAQGSPGDRDRPSSVFGFLMIDPLAGLDPATRELAQTRMAAERALYVAQRMPFMLRWQTELWSYTTAAMPETRQLLTNVTTVAAASDRLSRTVEQLPALLRREREEILKTVQAQQVELQALSVGVRDALEAGSQMASNANIALTSFDTVIQRLGESGLATGAEPFRISDYTAAAAQVDSTALRLGELLGQLDQTLASTNLNVLLNQVTPAVESAESSGRNLVDHAFRKLLLLLALACVLFLCTALLYRRLVGVRRSG